MCVQSFNLASLLCHPQRSCSQTWLCSHNQPTFKKNHKSCHCFEKVYGFVLSWAHAGLKSDVSKRGSTGLYSAQTASFMTGSQESLTELIVSPQEPADGRDKEPSRKPRLLFEHPSSSSASSGPICQHPWRLLGLFIQLWCLTHRLISFSHRV